jgi:dCMP deaminase
MPNILDLDRVFMNIAKEVATLSHCVRSKVGSVIVKAGNIVSFGYNGMPKGMDNCCESKKYMDSDAGGWLDPEMMEVAWPHEDSKGRYSLTTKPEVLHAESNAILKSGKNHQSVQDSTLYCTLSPCFDCAKLIIQAGITRVVYNELFKRDNGSVAFLSKYIKVEKISDV